jgi:hypothetical protein
VSDERLRGLTVRVAIETSERDCPGTFTMGDDESLTDLLARAADYVRGQLGWVASVVRTYADGYTQGQADALTWLDGAPVDDAPMAPIAEEATVRAALWCLARNLRDAAGCALAYDLGCSAEYARTPWDANLAGRPAPGWER